MPRPRIKTKDFLISLIISQQPQNLPPWGIEGVRQIVGTHCVRPFFCEFADLVICGVGSLTPPKNCRFSRPLCKGDRNAPDLEQSSPLFKGSTCRMAGVGLENNSIIQQLNDFFREKWKRWRWAVNSCSLMMREFSAAYPFFNTGSPKTVRLWEIIVKCYYRDYFLKFYHK